MTVFQNKSITDYSAIVYCKLFIGAEFLTTILIFDKITTEDIFIGERSLYFASIEDTGFKKMSTKCFRNLYWSRTAAGCIRV